MKETLTRSLTGALFVAAIVLSLLYNRWAYLALFSLISILAWVEYTNLYPMAIRAGLKISGAVLTASIFISVSLVISGMVHRFILLIPLFIFMVLFIQDRVNQIQAWKLRLFILVSGILYLALPLSMLHLMAWELDPGNTFSYRWILFLLLFLWTYDTMAYVSGKLTGRHPMWKKVSPRKTWEGAIGGLLFLMVLVHFMSRWVPDLNLAEWGFFGLIAAVTGTLGDFLESWMKRRAGLKDSGKLLPGHGGVLDRIDSLLLSTPFITLYLYMVL